MDIDCKDLISNIFDGLYLVDMDRTIVYWNASAERITGYTMDEVVGHACHDNILVHVDSGGRNLCRSMCLLGATIKDGKPRDAEIYLRHKNGHRVPIWARATQLKNSKGQVIGGAELFSDMSADNVIAHKIEELRHLSMIDSLTQLANRRYMEIELAGRISEKQRYNLPFGLLMLDIDHFKPVNDRYGHDVGDQVLRTLAKTILQSARPHDLYGRWGGEEFMGLIRSPHQGALEVVSERLRTLVASTFIEQNGNLVRVTASIGATMAKSGDSTGSILKRADTLLYASKQDGRNRCTFG
jgi:diguanylate cyclase (GGDEF)-like protein/PAS domain S-box-containing protein